MKSFWFRRSLCPLTVGACLIGFCMVTPSKALGQFDRGEDYSGAFAEQEPRKPLLAEGEKPPSLLIEIPDEPKTIDPATLVPPALAAKVTVAFDEKPIRDIAKWLQEKQQINVLIDYPALADDGLLAGEPITDRSDDAPLYLLLNRLETMNLAWYFEDETLFITTRGKADEHLLTKPYNLGDLFDSGYKSQAILRTIRSTTGGHWEDDDGEGGATVLLGDVLFVRQTDAGHLQVAGLLAAIRRHGRQTFAVDPPQHDILRQKLNEPFSVDFDEIPLNQAIKELARHIEADIRLDVSSLHDAGLSERMPVSLKMTDRPLNSILRALLLKLQLTWVLRDGVLEITTQEKADELHKTAVFDVRDLCRNQKESSGLMRAIHTQTRSKWEDVDGEGGAMISPKPGVLVVRNTERTLDEAAKLLESYRTALRISKPRENAESDPKELVIRYYRMQKDIANDLEKLLPELIQPETWRSATRPDANGTIRTVASKSELLKAHSPDPVPKANAAILETIVIPNSVLIIRQSREAHEAIAKLINKVQFGDAVEPHGGGIGGGMMGGMGGGGMGGMGGGGMGGMGGGGMGGMGGGMGGGGFGGGFFAVPSK